LLEVGRGLASDTGAGNLGRQCKVDGLLDREGSIVIIVLSVIDDLAGIAFLELGGFNASISDLAIDGKITVSLVGNSLNKRQRCVRNGCSPNVPSGKSNILIQDDQGREPSLQVEQRR
jgi:hypothetical protein